MLKIHRFRVQAFPLQLVLIVPFMLQIFGAVGLVGYLSFKNGQKAVNDLANQLMERTSRSVDQHLDSFLSVPHKIGQLNADIIRIGLLDLRDRKTVGKYFWHQMQTYDVSYIGIGLTTGEGVGAARYDGKTITLDDWSAKPPSNWYSYSLDKQGNRKDVLEILDWNSFEQPWYLEPIKAGKPIWSPIYTIYYPNHPYIATSAGRPIYDKQNRLLGMVSIDVSLLKLSNFLQSLEVSHSGQIFILERDGMLIANSGKEQPFTRVKDEISRLKATDSPNPIIQDAAQQLQQHFKSFSNISAHQELRLDLQGKPYYLHVTPWKDGYGLDWLVVVTVPEGEFMAQINANTRSTIGLCLAALAIASLLGVLTSHWIVRPIARLNQASEAMASGNLDQQVKESAIQELNALANSFNYMSAQLQASFVALETNNEELEDRVEARTLELQNALSQLQHTQAQVVQNEKMSSLGQLVAGVAHEINNPINFIHGNLVHLSDCVQELLSLIHLYQQSCPTPNAELQEVLEEIDLDFTIEDTLKILSSMKVGTERIRNIVLSLRNFSRLDEAEFKAVDIHEGIDSTLLILQHRLKATAERPEIQVIKDYGNLPWVECYAGQLNQVFMNILTNAIDAMEEGNAKLSFQEVQAHPNQITIQTTVIDEQWAQIAIADNGPGIAQRTQQQIFNPFFTTKPMGKGTGMGLSISYQVIAEKHKGKLECISNPGEGTQFIIQIPIHQNPAPVAPMLERSL